MEEWKDIEGYEGLYQVSNKGKVKSLKYRGSNNECVLKNRKTTKGYLQVALWKNQKHKEFQVHRIVAKAFIPNPDKLPQVNHKDENKTNNSVENLEWCTNEYNHNYGTRNLRASRGLNGEGSKQVYQFTIEGKLLNIWPSTMECGRSGYCQTSVSNCCIGKQKTHKGYKWCYEN